MRGKPERTAWAILLTAFALFVFLAVSIPLGIRWYIRYSQTERHATVESLAGTIVVEQPVGSGPVPLGKGQSMVVPEGTVVYADETSEAVVTFYDHSFMRVFSGAVVRLERLRAPRFSGSPLPATAAGSSPSCSVSWVAVLSRGCQVRRPTEHGQTPDDQDYGTEQRHDSQQLHRLPINRVHSGEP